MKRIVIIGARGMLGQALLREFGAEQPVAWDRDEIDISNAEDVRSKLRTLRPEIIVNAAAYNAVDACEQDQTEQAKAMAINGHALEFLSHGANEVGALLIHYSTDYVFDGSKLDGYSETDLPAPLSFYGRSKLFGEQAVQSIAKRYYLLRLSRLFGKPALSQNGKKSFVDVMLEKGRAGGGVQVVDDERSCPTHAHDLAWLTKELSRDQQPHGIYHAANHGACTWFEFAKKIFELAQLSTAVRPVPAATFARPAPRPAFSELLNTKLPPRRSWQAALSEYLHYQSLCV